MRVAEQKERTHTLGEVTDHGVKSNAGMRRSVGAKQFRSSEGSRQVCCDSETNIRLRELRFVVTEVSVSVRLGVNADVTNGFRFPSFKRRTNETVTTQ